MCSLRAIAEADSGTGLFTASVPDRFAFAFAFTVTKSQSEKVSTASAQRRWSLTESFPDTASVPSSRQVTYEIAQSASPPLPP